MSSVSKNVSPLRVFFILICIHLFLFSFILIFPEGRIDLGFTSVNFISYHDLLNKKEIEHKNIASIIESGTLDSTEFEKPVVAIADTSAEEIKIPEIRIENPAGENALQAFFEALFETEKNGKLIRIAHYGDSQIEGDRMTAYLRNRFQLRFGGGGPGFVQLMDPSNARITITQKNSPDWYKHSVYGVKSKKIEDNKFGPGGTVFRYTGGYFVVDSSNVDTIGEKPLKRYIKTNQPAWISFERSYKSYKTARHYSNLKLFYHNRGEQENVLVKLDEKVRVDTLKGGEMQTLEIDHLSADKVRITFNGSESPDIYGIALDADSGVAVDNFSMRGSSGTDFQKFNMPFLGRQLNGLNSKLLIIQYGINVVPYALTDQAIEYYKKQFSRQLKKLKSTFPDKSILVVSLNDISRKEGTDYVSYPNVTKIRNIQREAALEAGCAFWDLFEAMGGENSMVSWVTNKPPLASKDFIHLNPQGANILAELLYTALISEYELFRKNKLTEIKQVALVP